VGEIIAIDGQLPDSISIDLYGRLVGEFRESDFKSLRNVRYQGEIAHGLVPEMLSEHDALLLPTHYLGEGYPGVILEAFGAGIPVITTQWISISEIVDDSCGILIQPRNSTALAEAINRLVSDPALYLRLRAGAVAKGGLFASAPWAEVFVNYCRELAVSREGARATALPRAGLEHGK
jgi:glycosyltransferase involved in cell wall biosynthesis